MQTDDKYESVRKNVVDTDCIIIDEISMISAKVFEQLEAVCSVICGNNKVFGGKQIVLCGDFYQLSPVPDSLHGDDGKFCFESSIFKNCITHKVVLTQVMRQEEELLIQAVRETAVGTVSADTDRYLQTLQRPLQNDTMDKAVNLFARNVDAMLYNSDCLDKVDSEGRIYKANINHGNSKYLNKILAPNYLHLKVSCPVILLVNIGGKLVNGLQGIVRALNDDSVTVFFPQVNESHNIQRRKFTKYDMKSKLIVAEREQFPLVLGYGLTIHKAQGMTLEHVVVHCKGIFQPGQLSVAIGRAVSSNGLSLLDYKKGLCLLPKSVISKFYKEESCAFLDDFSCCKNFEHVSSEIDDNIVHSDSDSDFDLNELEFIEGNLINVSEDVDLPDFVDFKRLKMLNYKSEPVTDLQIKVNNICENCDHQKLKQFCGSQINRINDLMADVTPEKKTTPKEWTSLLSANHKYIISENYHNEIKKLFLTTVLSQEYLQFCSNIVMELLKLCTHNVSQNITFPQPDHSQTYTLSDSGKAKIRYVAGMCVAKQSHHHSTIIFSNLNNPDKTVYKHVQISKSKLSLLQKLVADKDVDPDDKTLQEIERKQNVRKALTYVTEQCFQFFLLLNTKIGDLLKTQTFKETKKEVFEYAYSCLENDEDLQMIFAEMVRDDHPDIVHSLYGELLHKYLLVCHKQFLKDTKDRLNVMKKKAHREEIKKKAEKRKSAVGISIGDIITDTSDKKETSHLKLKLNCIENEKFFSSREFTKQKLGQLCSAYDVPFEKSMKKQEMASKLREKIISCDNVLHPELLSAEVTEPLPSSSKRKRANVPSKGKGKGKGKKTAVHKYYCKICKEEYVEGEEWIQCDECNEWLHRTCDDIPDDTWEDLQTEDSGDWICSICSQ